ncbi:MAG: MopE-related protein [Polyangiaceae bacterium]
MSLTVSRAGWALVVAMGLVSGCSSGPGESTSSTGGQAGEGGESTGGNGATGGGGQAGTGGTGGSTETTGCTPGTSEECYSGPEGTLGVGVCAAGVRYCKANGEGFGPCLDEVLPAAETCATPVDDDCEGLVTAEGAGCACVPGAPSACYSGPAGTEGVGECHAGTQTCNDEGTGYGPCTGEVTPAPEACATAADDDCDGAVNNGCVCVPGATEPCYSGPAGTEGTGICKAGMRACDASGQSWGACVGEVTPMAETCANVVDDDCDGQINEEGPGCPCPAGQYVACYPGPLGTEGVGACKSGLALCNEFGTKLGPCVGAVTPVPETCDTPVDDDCDGQANEDGVGCVCQAGEMTGCYTGPAGTLGFGTCAAGTATCQANGAGYGQCMGEVVPQAEDCSTPVDEDCSDLPDCGTPLWAKGFGAAGQQQAYDIATDASGNVYVVGSFAQSIDFGGGPLVSAGGTDVFLVKLDPDGNHLWSKGFGSAGIYQEAFGVAVDAGGNVTIAGYFNDTIDFGGGVLTCAGLLDAFVARFDPSGAHLFSAAYGDATVQVAADVATDAQGNVLVLVNGYGTVDFGGGPLTSAGEYDSFVAKLSPAGAHVWSKRFGSALDDDATGIAVDAGGNVLVSGALQGTVDFGGGPLTSAGALDAYVLKLSSGGAHVWSKVLGDGANQGATAVAVGGAGHVVLLGAFEGAIDVGMGALVAGGPADLFVAKLNASGVGLWSHGYGGAGTEIEGQAITAGPDGRPLVVGSVSGDVSFGGGTLQGGGARDLFALRLDAAGGHAWSKRAGGPGNQYATAAAVNLEGDPLIAGHFESTLFLGEVGEGTLLSSFGGLDVVVAKLAK